MAINIRRTAYCVSQLVDPVHDTQPRAEGTGFEEQGLNGPATPPFALDEEAFDRFSRQSHAQAFIEVNRLVALAQHDQGGQQILCDALRRNAANGIDRLATHDAARAAAKGGLPRVA
jgi:hypothetical protein